MMTVRSSNNRERNGVTFLEQVQNRQKELETGAELRMLSRSNLPIQLARASAVGNDG